MYMAFQNVHAPIEAPEKYIKKYDFITDKMRRVHAAMTDILDEAVGNITDAFKTAGLVGGRSSTHDLRLEQYVPLPMKRKT